MLTRSSLLILILALSVQVSYSASFFSQNECEETTQQRCSYVMCDYIPQGKTFEEVCGKDFQEGWAPSPHMIGINPGESAEIKSVMLKIAAPFSNAELTIKGNGRVNYEARDQAGKIFKEEKELTDDQMLDLATAFNDKNFFLMRDHLENEAEMQDGSVYTLGLEIRTFRPGMQEKTIFEGMRSVSCLQDSCEKEFLEIKDLIHQFWGDQILEIGI